jgi:hypothetical protein
MAIRRFETQDEVWAWQGSCSVLARLQGGIAMSVLGTTIMLSKKGFAVHWIRPRSKAPITEGWSTAPVARLTELCQTYHPGYNLGVRCGYWSRPLPGCGLVILDVDIRNPELSPRLSVWWKLSAAKRRRPYSVAQAWEAGICGMPVHLTAFPPRPT